MNSFSKEFPSREELAWALTTLMDGVKQHDIHEMTGLDVADIGRIWRIYIAAQGVENDY